MSFAAPLWLLLLIPWGVLLFYLMLGKAPREPVPFLSLWRGPEAKRSVKPAISKLPIWIALLMLAAAAAVLAAAGPVRVTDAPAGEAPAGSVGISAAAVRVDQVMVRVLNPSTRREATLTLAWPGGGRAETLALPATGEQAYFLDVPPDLTQLSLRLGDQAVELSRQRTWPRIEAFTPLPESLRRMLSAYQTTRPPSDDSATVAVAADEPSLAGRAGVILAGATSPSAGRVAVIDHAVTRNVDWPAVLAGAGSAEPPAGFTPLVRIGERPAVAVRQSPRQVWVGFDAPDFASRVDYVVFWTNVFDYAGQGADHWRAAPGTTFAVAGVRKVVQTRVQNLAPVLTLSAVSLTLASILTAGRRGRPG